MKKELSFADLHVHSYYSDGTHSPAQILALAEEKGIGTLAIADHDVFNGSLELMKLSENSRVKCIPAVEITCDDFGRQIHVLAYHPDFTDDGFCAFVSDGRRKLDGMSMSLIEKMKAAGYSVSVEDFNAFNCERGGGGWKALHYFKSIGLTNELKDGFSLYPKFGCGYETAGFPSVCEAVSKIHSVGGIAVIAHPGVSVKTNDCSEFIAELEKLVGYGADGIECFYSEHTAEITALCECFCDEHGLLKTCGSDFHGSFLTRQLGTPCKKTEELRLDGII